MKCGQLYDEFIEGERLKMLSKFYDLVATRQKDEKISDDDRKELEQILELLRTKKGVRRERVADVLHKNVTDIDLNKLFRPGQHNVGKTYSGVELMHFCANDLYHDEWPLKNIKPLGAVVFWQFIVPQVINIMEIVGCEYLFLFAADGFTDRIEHIAAMPLYDLNCKFMFQKTVDLKERRSIFFENFNPDKDAI